MVRRGK
jgi:hypothetical protein